MSAISKILQKSESYLRVSENTQIMSYTVYEVALRLTVLAACFAIVPYMFLKFYNAVTLGVLFAFQAMLAAELLGKKRNTYYISKTRHVFAKIFATLFLIFTFLVLLGAFLTNNVNQASELIMFICFGVLSITLLIQAARKPIENPKGTK
jgi:hypothetical protein